jgi:hypothetical protein
MTENILILVFTYAFGMASGRALRDYQLAKQTVIGMTALYNSNWWNSRSSEAKELHLVQDVTGTLPPAPLQMKVYRGSGWEQSLWNYERWKVPKLRRSE